MNRFDVQDLEVNAGSEYKSSSLGMRLSGKIAAASKGILLPKFSATGEVSAIEKTIFGLPTLGGGYSSFSDARVITMFIGSEFYPASVFSFFSFKVTASMLDMARDSSLDLKEAFSINSRVGKEFMRGIDIFASFAIGEEASVIAQNNLPPAVRIYHFKSIGPGGRIYLGSQNKSIDINVNWTKYSEIDLELIFFTTAVNWRW